MKKIIGASRATGVGASRATGVGLSRNRPLRGIILLLIILLTLSGRATCIKGGGKSKPKVSSSNDNDNLFIINAPSNLTAIAISYSQINLSWIDNSINEDGFSVERKIWSNNTWQEIYRTTTDTTYYYDINTTDYPPFSVYYYRVRAFNTLGDYSDYSNEASVAINLNIVWSSIATGVNHNIAITNENALWVWGNNEYGQLGLGDVDDKITPSQIGIETVWSLVSLGELGSLALKSNGSIWAWGYNGEGQLGQGTTQFDELRPIRTGTNNDWFNIAAGYRHMVALKTNSTLWSWGYNGQGQLGLNDTEDRYTVTQVGSNADWSIIASGSYHTIACKTDGSLWGWGWNYDGQLGDGTIINRTSPRPIGTQTDWSEIKGGNNYTLSTKNNSTLWSWGDNNYGQLGLGYTSDRINTPKPIGSESDWLIFTAGDRHSLAIKSMGTMWSWGNNAYGQLGIGNKDDRYRPTLIGTETDWSRLAAGSTYTLVLKTNGTLWAWGENSNGQLGFGDTIERNGPYPFGSPAPPSSLIATLIAELQVVLTWTDCSYNEEGFKIERRTIGTNPPDGEAGYELLITTNVNITSYDDLELIPDTVYYYRISAYNTFGESPYSNEVWISSTYGNGYSVAGGEKHTVKLNVNGEIWCWGDNEYGQLGLGDTIDRLTQIQILIPPEQTWSAISVGGKHTLARKTDDTIWSWGLNDKGQLGLGNSGTGTNRKTPSLISPAGEWSTIVAGDNNSFAIKTDGTIWGWGLNNLGQLGTGNLNNRTTPSQIGTNSDWSNISAGDYHTIAIKTNHTMSAWSYYNVYGQLGIGTTENKIRPTPIGSDSDWYSVAAGGYHTIALKINSSIWSWGYNPYGQLGLGDSGINRLTPTQIGTESIWSMVTAGSTHSLGLKTNGTIWSWGKNDCKQLGLGDGINRNTPLQIGLQTDWVSVTTGRNHSMAIKSGSSLYLWGDNQYGQLGLGDTINRNTPTMIPNE